MPTVAVAYRSCLPPPSILDVGFCSAPLSRVSADFQDIRVVTLWQLIMRSLREDNMRSWVFERSQIPDIKLTTLTPKGWGSEGPLPPPMPTGRRTGGIHLKVTGYLEGEKVQGWTAVFNFDAVLLRCPIRLRIALTHQEEHRS